MPQPGWIALTVVAAAALLAPYAVGVVRKRVTHPELPMRLYGPHLIFVCTVRIAPMFAKAVPSVGATALAFVEAFVVWALCAATSEWFLRRRAHRGA
jgi:hypothetical protein